MPGSVRGRRLRSRWMAGERSRRIGGSRGGRRAGGGASRRGGLFGDGWIVERAAEHDRVVDPVVVAELALGEGAGPEQFWFGDAGGEVARCDAGEGGGEVVVTPLRFVDDAAEGFQFCGDCRVGLG